LVVRDVVANLLHRLGMVGAIVIASALIFGAVAGGVIVHRLDTTPSASSEQAQGDESGEKTSDAAKKTPASKSKPANNDQQDSSESEDSQDKDV
jgi:uncharacterized membrane protein